MSGVRDGTPGPLCESKAGQFAVTVVPDRSGAHGRILTRARAPRRKLHALQPLAFVDDYLPYFVGVQQPIHRALILRGPNGSPNAGDSLRFVDSRHEDLRAFAAGSMARSAR